MLIIKQLMCYVTLFVALSCSPDLVGDYDESETSGTTENHDTTNYGDSGFLGNEGWEEKQCAEEARWIYLVGSGRAFVRYYPDENRLERVGTLNCPSGGASPFSMSVDRDARAWVLHQNGLMYRVSTTDASCTSTNFVALQQGMQLFGMGFASKSQGSAEETLYIAGGLEENIATGSATFGTIDMDTLTVQQIGHILGWPELTGTGLGYLWGFFPDTSPPSIRQLDKDSGDTIQSFPLNVLQGMTASAWAFAFWGGRFYVFLQRQTDFSTHIWLFDPETGSFEDIYPDTGFHFVGAGVSTCAPVVLI